MIMKSNEKKAILKLLGGIGFIVLIVGVLTPWYETTNGFIGALLIWIIAGALRIYWKVQK